jgi:nitrate reductase gamma subunit
VTAEGLLAWARGPAFAAALAFMVLGLARRLGLAAWEGWRIYGRAGDRRIPVARVARETLRWLVPWRRLGDRWFYGLSTVVLHASVLLVPSFLAGHVALVRRALGISWPALPNAAATALTIAGIAAVAAVVIQRAAARDSRPLGRFQDHALPLLIGAVLATGFMVMHPAWNPFSRDPVLLLHALGADLLLVLVPLTKLSHMILMPFTQLISELAWHFPPDAGARVGAALGKEREPV